MDPFCYSAMLSCLFLVDFWSPVGKKADFLALLCVMFSCVFIRFPIWCHWSGVVFDYINS